MMDTALRAEAWARKHLQLAQPIAFPEEWAETDRNISGEFLVEALLDPQWTKTPNGFLLANAVVTTPFERRYAQIDTEVCFENCVFDADVALPYADFRRQVRFLGCTFRRKSNMQACRAPDLEYGQSGKGIPTVFHGEVNFFSCEITGHLFCRKVRFLSREDVANFNSAKIGNNAFFQESIFQGPVDFGHAEIGRNLACQDAQFLDDRGETIFNSVKISGSAFFDRSTFKGAVDLGDGTFARNVSLIGAQFVKSLSLSNTSIAGTLYVFSMKGAGGNGAAAVTKLPPVADLRGLIYGHTDLEYDNQWQLWLGLRRYPDSYDPSPYLTLESYFHRSGRDDLADKVHYEMRKAEGQALWRQRRLDKWAWNWLLRWMVGYGVYGWRLFLWAGVVLVPAWLYFVISLKHTIEPDKPISLWSLIYTMDVFLPVDLNQEELYSKPGPLFAIVKFATKLWGWLIVPLAMAQLAGLLKKKR
jgi:hypothetical protein